jgi:S-adenosylmethionine:tRNA ribosyltransferase-isomerase
VPVLEAVELRDGALLEGALEPVERPLQPVEAPVDAAPAGGDQVDENGEIVDAGQPLGVHVTLKPLEPADRLVREAAYLRDMTADGDDLDAHALAQSCPEPLGDGRLELRGPARERFECLSGALEGRVQRSPVGGGGTGLAETDSGALDGLGFHERDASVRVGRPMRTDELDYDLPLDLIAQRPLERRDASRLLVYDRRTRDIRHRFFRGIVEDVAGSLVVVNDTRVLPARLRGVRPGGGDAEILLLEPLENGLWEALARPTRRLRPGMRLGPVELVEHAGEGRWHVVVHGEPDGEAPLPPYITEPLRDPARYQTVYAARAGSAAAPTAGLHFTPELLASLEVATVTLHVGLDTFRPIAAAKLADHEMHSERYEVTPDAWKRIQAAEHVVAVGTTTARVLESLARDAPLAGRTDLFIRPGFEFRRVDALLTNFHLPRSTLLALVMAFAGVEATRRLYRLAIEERYRFYSFGDAMLVL